MQTAGVWTYDIETNKLLYYKYNKDNRIWSFFIEGKNIYYIELSENMQNNTFKWSLIKSDLEFNKKKIIDNGILYKPTDTPTFIRKNNSIILHAVYDEIKYKDDFKLTDYKSQFSIKLYKNNNFIELVNKKGNHIKKTGEFSCNSQSIINFQNDKLIYCTVSYGQSEKIIELNTQDSNEKIIYENKLLDKYSLISFVAISSQIYIVNLKNKLLMDNSELINISEKKSVILSNLAYISKIDKEKILVISNNIFTIYSTLENKFKYKLNINGKYKNSYYLYKNSIITIDTDNNITIFEISV